MTLWAGANAQQPARPYVGMYESAQPSILSDTDDKEVGLLRDVKVAFPEVLPTFLPTSLIDNMPVKVAVTNLGSETVSGKISLRLGQIVVGNAEFADLAANTTKTVEIVMSDGDQVATGKTTLTAIVELEGAEDEDAADNTASETVTVSEHEFAYDHTTASMYVDKHALGLPDFGNSLYANSFHVSNPVLLDSVSAGYGRIEGEKVGVYVWKWDAKAAPMADGTYLLGEQIYFGTHNQGIGRGIHYYPLEKSIYLEPGDYMVGISFYGWGIATDLSMPNQMYSVYATTDGAAALDWSGYNLGTAAIRTYVSNVTAGISTQQGAAVQAASISFRGNMLEIAAGDSDLSSVAVYSTSGIAVVSEKISGRQYSRNLSDLTPGVYLVKLTTKNASCVKKIAVE